MGHNFESNSPLCPPLPGITIELFFSTSSKTLSPKINLVLGYRGWIWLQELTVNFSRRMAIREAFPEEGIFQGAHQRTLKLPSWRREGNCSRQVETHRQKAGRRGEAWRVHHRHRGAKPRPMAAVVCPEQFQAGQVPRLWYEWSPATWHQAEGTRRVSCGQESQDFICSFGHQ